MGEQAVVAEAYSYAPSDPLHNKERPESRPTESKRSKQRTRVDQGNSPYDLPFYFEIRGECVHLYSTVSFIFIVHYTYLLIYMLAWSMGESL
jgi:hypothetical protein